jgi:hypothetical protein
MFSSRTLFCTKFAAAQKSYIQLNETAGAAAKLYTVDNPEINVDWRPTVQGLFLQHGVIRDPKKGRLTCCMGLCEADIGHAFEKGNR